MKNNIKVSHVTDFVIPPQNKVLGKGVYILFSACLSFSPSVIASTFGHLC